MTKNTPKMQVKENIEAKLSRQFGCTAKEASREQMYKAAALTVKDILTAKRADYKNKVNEEGAKRVYYMCMEFLLGRSLRTNLCNLGLAEELPTYISKSDVYFCGNGFSNINQMYRINPQLIYNIGKMNLGVEYQYTAVQ